MGSSTEHSRVRADRQPVGPRTRAGRQQRRLGGGGRGVPACRSPRHRHRRLDPPAGRPDGRRRHASPTYGRVSRYGIIAFASSLDQVGPFARDVRDAALLLGAIAGRDERDSTSAPVAVPDYAAALRRRCRRRRRSAGSGSGLPREYFVAGMEPEVEARVREAVAALAGRRGRDRRRRPAPHATTAWPPTTSSPRPRRRPTWPATTGCASGSAFAAATSWRTTWRRAARASATRSSGASCSARTPCRPATTTPTTSRRRRSARSSRTTSTRPSEQVDALVAPTSPTVAFPIGARLDDPVAMYLSDACTLPVNVAGLPGLSVPCGLVGRPAGRPPVHRPAWDEGRLFGLGRGYEAITADAPWRALEPADLAALDDPATPTRRRAARRPGPGTMSGRPARILGRS